MKAARIHSHGGHEVLRVDTVARPSPSDRQVLVKVKGASLNALDTSLRAGEMKVITQFQLPKTLGFDLAGEVVECGKRVTSFVPGDKVAAMTGVGGGAAAEYASVDQENVARLPEGVDMLEASAVPLAASTALQGLRGIAQLHAGQKVLVSGASGGVGGFAVQIAKLLGGSVTALCRDEHFDYVRGLGADEMIDYRDDGASKIDERFDVVFDCSAKMSLEQVQSLARHGGRVVTTRPEAKKVVQGFIDRLRGAFTYDVIMVRPRGGDIAFVLELLRQGRLQPCLRKGFPLGSVADAHRYFEEESVAGKVVLTVD
ncbi:NADP-dependent oxidoreductase [Pelagicoccus sp. SDUM812002]|uniref:NADP-dependent oxidoreductase n=1 Tax=Pelagicoccus sp. SDUM812002 TaxID=3041266 RepID=UPI00281098A7|nr:NADP-dependent oxidoreductase [Pelagicoccus sp. SDUM812002]MDQ8187395.1 NADP-dependent oxidoreductase [Pelagicoccus sp. SDUM812002]